jgi:hypothetical protein
MTQEITIQLTRCLATQKYLKMKLMDMSSFPPTKTRIKDQTFVVSRQTTVRAKSTQTVHSLPVFKHEEKKNKT